MFIFATGQSGKSLDIYFSVLTVSQAVDTMSAPTRSRVNTFANGAELLRGVLLHQAHGRSSLVPGNTV